MNIIVLQHINIEDPGYIKDLMIDDGVKITTIELDEGEKIPNNLSSFDAMFCKRVIERLKRHTSKSQIQLIRTIIFRAYLS